MSPEAAIAMVLWAVIALFVLSLFFAFTWVLWVLWPPLGIGFVLFAAYVIVGLFRSAT